ncbi:MAG TPA: hypothetical protein VEK08_23880, partial [Planctomycetota bacterium]|nr:hypothetical protein [Planctomycetota bacterium]
MNLHRWRHVHPLAVMFATAVLAVFAWLNFESTREDYVAEFSTGYRGGVRQGFPFVWWDAGNDVAWVNKPGMMALQLTPFGGIQGGGLAANLAIGGVALLLAGIAGQFLGRRFLGRFSALSYRDATPPRRLGPVSAILAALTLLSLVWINLQVDVYSQQELDGLITFQQRMGWPLTIYSASNPAPEILSKVGVAGKPAETLAWLRQNPDTWYQRTHWHELNIVLNLAAGVILVCAAACCNEFRRRQPK